MGRLPSFSIPHSFSALSMGAKDWRFGKREREGESERDQIEARNGMMERMEKKQKEMEMERREKAFIGRK